MSITRRQAREWAVQMLTAADLNPPSEVEGFIASCWEEFAANELTPSRVPDRYKQFTEERVRGVLANQNELDSVISSLLENWELDRLGTVERVVLRLGAWEILYSDVPAPVVINEAVDLVNWFSSPNSRALINGILDKFAHENKEKEINQ